MNGGWGLGCEALVVEDIERLAIYSRLKAAVISGSSRVFWIAELSKSENCCHSISQEQQLIAKFLDEVLCIHLLLHKNCNISPRLDY